MRSRLLAAAAVAAALLVPLSPAHAADVTVRFGLSAGTYAPTGAACTLAVPAGADGTAVLEAAVAARCIVSYDTVTYGGIGTFVTCIDFVCGQNAPTGTLGTYWNMYENGASAGHGVDGFVASEGAELAFAYKAYCFEVVCPPEVG